MTRMEIACERAGRGRFRAREIEHVEVALQVLGLAGFRLAPFLFCLWECGET